ERVGLDDRIEETLPYAALGLGIRLLLKVLAHLLSEGGEVFEITNATRELVVEFRKLRSPHLEQLDPCPILPRCAFAGLRVGELERELVLLAGLQRADRRLDRRHRLAGAKDDVVLPRLGSLRALAQRSDLHGDRVTVDGRLALDRAPDRLLLTHPLDQSIDFLLRDLRSLAP